MSSPVHRAVVPRGYKGVAAQMDTIASEFKGGMSMTRLSRKYVLPLDTVELVIRMKMIEHDYDQENQEKGG